MARYEHLPIYKDSYALMKACYRALAQMPRGHKASIGERLVNSSIRQTQLIVYANGAEKKDAALVKLILEIENMVLILRIATDLQAMSVEASKLLKGRLLDVKKQAQAWRAWAKEEAKKLALAAEKQKHGNDFPGESRGIKKAGSQMSQSSRALGARDKAGPWEPKPDSTKRKV